MGIKTFITYYQRGRRAQTRTGGRAHHPPTFSFSILASRVSLRCLGPAEVARRSDQIAFLAPLVRVDEELPCEVP